MAFHAWLLNRISRLCRSLPAATNEAENWELISYWAEKTPALLKPTELECIQIYMATFCKAVIFHWSCFSIRNKEIVTQACLLWVFWWNSERWSLWGKELKGSLLHCNSLRPKEFIKTFMTHYKCWYPHKCSTSIYICSHTPTRTIVRRCRHTVYSTRLPYKTGSAQPCP